MEGKGKVFLSNQLDPLADRLSRELFPSCGAPLSVFEQRLVIVPNEKIDRYLLSRMAKQLPVATGLRMMHMHRVVKEWFRIPSKGELSLRLEYEIKQLFSAGGVYPEPFFEPLADYLEKEQGEEKLGALCDELADIFLRHRLLRQAPDGGWQKKLWQKVFPSDPVYPSFEGRAHLFGFHFLPKLYLDFFNSRGSYFYCLSPCELFWEDLCTDRERAHLQKSLEEDQEAYLEDHHPLLGNMGNLGRLFIRSLDTEEQETEELYREPEGDSLLKEVQRDLLKMRRSSPKQDGSIQVHAAPSKQREVEILLETLHRLLDHKKLMPSDVLVVAPDINAYAPYIHMVFGSSDSRLDYRIYDLEIHADVQVLLDIPAKRFDLASLFKLFSLPAFLQKMDFSAGDAALLKEWARKAHILWGVDEEQRQSFFPEKLLAESPSGTWEHGFERMLGGLAFLPEEEELSGVLPCVELSEAVLLGKWIRLLRRLKEDLKPLHDGKERSLKEWSLLVKTLAEDYLGDSLNLTELALEDLEKPIFGYASFHRVLNTFLSRKNGSFQPSHLQSVSFCSAAAYPAKVLCILGMHEESFPRQERKSSLCNLNSYAPSQIDQDRYLFLEWILSAQEYLILSYQKWSARDHKPQNPSIVVQELLGYLSSVIPIADHPSLGFLEKEVRLPSAYRAAMAYYHPSLSPNPPQIWHLGTSAPGAEDLFIEIRHLVKLARHPIQFYFHRTLQLYLDEDAEENQEFHCSYAEKARLRTQTLNYSFESLWKAAEEKGRVPLGAFKHLAYAQVREEVEELREHLGAWGVNEVFSVEFKAGCAEACFLAEGKWMLPPLQIPLKGGRQAHLVGKLSDFSSCGMLFSGEDSLKDLLKAWPSFLIFLHLKLGSPRLLLTKEGTVKEAPAADPLSLLASYIEYYELASKNISPLMPLWAKALLKGTAEDLEGVLSSKWSAFSDPYLDWLARRGSPPEARLLFETWAMELRDRFAPLIQWAE